jgi:hypothetical protein
MPIRLADLGFSGGVTAALADRTWVSPGGSG